MSNASFAYRANLMTKQRQVQPKVAPATHEGNMNRWTVIVGALIVQVILGTVYAFSVFVRPLEMEFGWDRATTQWAFSFALASFAITMIPAGRLQDRIGPRIVATIGGILLGLSFLLGALIVDGSRPWALYLTYGIIGGAGIGFGYVCPIAAAVKWFPDKKGLITGLAVAGFGAGALFFAGPASSLLLPPAENTEALSFYEIVLVGLGIIEGGGVGIGWRTFFVLHGIVAASGRGAGRHAAAQPARWLDPRGLDTRAQQKKERRKVAMNWPAMLNTPLGLYAVVDLYLWRHFGPHGHWPVDAHDGRRAGRADLCPGLDGHLWPLY